MGIADALIVYFLALGLIPLTVIAYAMSYVIVAKDPDHELAKIHYKLRWCSRAAFPYFAGITSGLIFLLAINP